MKRKNSRSIKMKLTWALLASAGLAGGCILLLSVGMLIGSLSRPFALFFNRHVFWFLVGFMLIFAGLFIAFFQRFTRRNIHYLGEITHHLDKIGAGDLEIQIPVKSNDELGKMAETVNDMAGKLRASLAEERRLEQSKNDLITNISHDLRTPLTSILGYLELIHRLEGADGEKLRQFSRIAYQQCQDLKVLIDDLFEFSKLHHLGVKVNLRAVNLRELLEQVVLGFMPALGEAGLDYRLRFPRERLLVEADPILLKRVFDNLIHNAITYGSGGTILEVELRREQEQVVTRVINDGKAIPAADLPHLFERFFRGENGSRTEPSRGSGLGLAIAKSIVELHQGTIGVRSEAGRTVFEVRLHGMG